MVKLSTLFKLKTIEEYCFTYGSTILNGRLHGETGYPLRHYVSFPYGSIDSNHSDLFFDDAKLCICVYDSQNSCQKLKDLPESTIDKLYNFLKKS